MAENSAIAWTRSTFNPWIGCTRVGPGCDHCYAEVQDSRKRWGSTTHWGTGVARYRTSASNWFQVTKWNRQAPDSEFAGRRGFWPVFCASLADVFDNAVPAAWRYDLWTLISVTPNLSWLLVTKRIGNVSSMVPEEWRRDGFPPWVRIISTIVNQEEADRDISKLLALPCKNGISYEPALGPVDWRRWLYERCACGQRAPCWLHSDAPRKAIEWIIVGGESAQGGAAARPFKCDWAYSTISQCKAAGIPVFVKQLGSNGRPYAGLLKDRAGADPAEWPEDLRVREFPL